MFHVLVFVLSLDHSAMLHVPALPLFQSTTIGLWKAFSLSLNFLNASLTSLAPLTTVPAFAGPKYSRMLLS